MTSNYWGMTLEAGMMNRRNGETGESWNGGKWPQMLKDGIAEQRKMTPDPKRENLGRQNGGKSAETLKDRMTENPPKSLKMESRNGGKSPEILNDGMMENHQISQEELAKVKKARVCESSCSCKIMISFVVVKNL